MSVDELFEEFMCAVVPDATREQKEALRTVFYSGAFRMLDVLIDAPDDDAPAARQEIDEQIDGFMRERSAFVAGRVL
jgi:hypothetical protein